MVQLYQNARDVGSSPALGTIIPICITPTSLVAVTMDPIQTKRWVLVETALFICICYGHCLYVCNPKHNKTYNSRGTSVLVCTDLWGMELHREVGVGIVVTSGKPMWCNDCTLAQNAKDVGLSSTLGTVFPMFITPRQYCKQ